nr:meprin-B [mice, kidney, Peptide Partial, 10 aa] [Mus sp.]
LPAPEGFVSD